MRAQAAMSTTSSTARRAADCGPGALDKIKETPDRGDTRCHGNHAARVLLCLPVTLGMPKIDFVSFVHKIVSNNETTVSLNGHFANRRGGGKKDETKRYMLFINNLRNSDVRYGQLPLITEEGIFGDKSCSRGEVIG